MIPRDTLAPIADAASEFHLLDDSTLDFLRGRWRGLRFTLCGDDDVPVRRPPVLERPGFNVYLVNGSEHCLTLTNDRELAIGVVLPWMGEE